MAVFSVGDWMVGMRPASSDGFGGEGGEFSGVMTGAGDGRVVLEVEVVVVRRVGLFQMGCCSHMATGVLKGSVVPRINSRCISIQQAVYVDRDERRGRGRGTSGGRGARSGS